MSTIAEATVDTHLLICFIYKYRQVPAERCNKSGNVSGRN